MTSITAIIASIPLSPDSDMEDVYDGQNGQPIYTSYMRKSSKKRKESIEVIIDTPSWNVISDKEGNPKRNICFNAIAVRIPYQEIKLIDKNKAILLIAPRKTFGHMLRNAGIDIRGNPNIYQIIFLVFTQKNYKITDCKIFPRTEWDNLIKVQS